MNAFAPATKKAARARIGLAGPSGSGKTYTALSLAFGLGEHVAVIDTERGSASKYVGLNGWKFDTSTPDRFSPASLVSLLGDAAGIYDVVIVDSLSHYWSGVDGMLEQVDRHRSNGGNFGGWKEERPAERRMIDALLGFPGHVIVTLRVKTEYVIEENERGKKVPRKVGLKPEQRDGIEYEFDVMGDLDHSNTLAITKSRVPELSGAYIDRPGLPLAETIRSWLSEGTEQTDSLGYRDLLLAAEHRSEIPTIMAEIEAAGLRNAPARDRDGNPCTLADLANATWHSLPLEAS